MLTNHEYDSVTFRWGHIHCPKHQIIVLRLKINNLRSQALFKGKIGQFQCPVPRFPQFDIFAPKFTLSHMYLVSSHCDCSTSVHSCKSAGLGAPPRLSHWPQSEVPCNRPYHLNVKLIYIDGLGQVRRNSSALAMGFRLSCNNPSIFYCYQCQELS